MVEESTGKQNQLEGGDEIVGGETLSGVLCSSLSFVIIQ